MVDHAADEEPKCLAAIKTTAFGDADGLELDVCNSVIIFLVSSQISELKLMGFIKSCRMILASNGRSQKLRVFTFKRLDLMSYLI